MKLKSILPLFHLFLASVLLLIGHKQLETQSGYRMYANFGPPATRICYALNAPAAVVRWSLAKARDRIYRMSESAEAVFDDAVFLASVATLWFLIALQILSWRQGQETRLPRRMPLRITAYLILLLVVVISGLLGIGAWTTRSWRYTPMLQATLEGVLYLLWAITLTIIYGRELLKRIRPGMAAAGTRA